MVCGNNVTRDAFAFEVFAHLVSEFTCKIHAISLKNLERGRKFEATSYVAPRRRSE